VAIELSQPTYKRQRFLLAFIRQIKNRATATDLQKLVFLYSMEERSDYYKFVPYKFGPYSFQVAEDIDILRRDGYLSTDDSYIEATGDYPYEELFEIADERSNNLIKMAYRKYPYYSINSEIINRLFSGDEAEKFKHERENYARAEQVLFTIGYEGKSIELFMNTLIKNDVRLLCDVRKNPLSRKLGFSKAKLAHISEMVGIRYVHIPELGINSDKRAVLDTVEDYQNLFEDYAKTLYELSIPLENVYSLLCENKRIALVCYEKEPHMCHRHVVRDYLISNYHVRSENL